MMFTGLYTALVTPFLENGVIDKMAFYRLLDFQIENEVDGIVILGTTGESPTIGTDEHDWLIKTAVKYIDGRCKVIAGTGSNATSEAIHHSQYAESVGPMAYLS